MTEQNNPDSLTNQQVSEQTDSSNKNDYSSAATKYYALGLLTIVYSFNFIDRQLLSILQESIKEELLLSDSQLGLLTGFAFAVFYVTAGIPIARFADRSNRRNIIAFSVGLWSLMTALSGLVQNYAQLLIALKGETVGIREIRKHLLAYIRSFPGAKAVRSDLARVSSLQEIDTILDPYLS